MSNLYAPPQAAVRDVADPAATIVLAERGTRLGASILDGLVFGVLVYMPFIAFGLVGAAASKSGDEAGGSGMLGLGFVVGLAGFAIFCWLNIRNMMRNGQSIGKKMVGIKVVRRDGAPVSLGRLIWLRNVLIWAMGLIPLFGLVDSLFIFAESRQCLHDKIADTIVVVA
jgi:uncharacterized RDD family membrane protein YckC